MASEKTKPAESESRQRILLSALSLFAKQGFDGTSVDSIAKAAGVNKALIYYYFKSKRELLEALLELFRQKLGEVKARFPRAEEGAMSEEMFRESSEAIHGFLLDHKELMRVILLEDLKGGNESVFLKLWNAEFGQALSRRPPPADPDSPFSKSRIATFSLFFQDLPMMFYILLGEEFGRLVDIPGQELTETLHEIGAELHEKFYKSL